MSEPVIRFNQVYKAFRDVPALNGLSFSVPSTGCLGLLGPNGAGKTTALKALLGLVRIDSGDIANRSRRIGYVPQQPALFGWMTVEENLRFVAGSVGLSPAMQSEEIDLWLQRLGIADVKRRRASALSGGMRQRLAICLAMIQDPDVLVLDEPVSAMDPIGRHEILHLITELKRERSIVMSTHILDDAERVCDNVVIMHKGERLLQQRMADLQANITARYEIELDASPDAIALLGQQLSEELWVAHVEVQGPVISIVLADESANVTHLLSVLGSVGSESVTRIEKSKPSLEDIFLQVVKKA